jgi:hypothetical protein
LKLQYDEPLSSFAFKLNLGHYNMVMVMAHWLACLLRLAPALTVDDPVETGG